MIVAGILNVLRGVVIHRLIPRGQKPLAQRSQQLYAGMCLDCDWDTECTEGCCNPQTNTTGPKNHCTKKSTDVCRHVFRLWLG